MAVTAALLIAAPAPASTFGPSGPIFIDGSTTSPLLVEGLPGPVTDVTVTLNDFTHDNPEEADIFLVSPSGTRLALMSDVCGPMAPGSPIDLTFDDDAPNDVPPNGPCSSGTYKPGDDEPNAFGEPYAEYPQFNGFYGEVTNGYWTLEAMDDQGGSQVGSIGSWTITLTSGGTPPITISSGNQAFGPASPFPAELFVLNSERRIITDLDVALTGVTHQDGHHIDMFLEGPTGARSWLMSDVCPGNAKVMDWTIDDEAPNAFDHEESCGAGTFRARNNAQGGGDVDTFSAGAPAPPAGTLLSAFDLTDPDGTWKLWIQDDEEGREGFITEGWSLEMDTRPPADVKFAVAAQEGAEGSTVVVDVTRGAGGAAMGAGTIVVATSSGTAQSGSDFTPVSQTLAFGPGETTKSVAVPIAADGDGEPQQDFSLMLGAGEGDAKAGTPAAIGITIPADPGAPRDDTPTGNEDKPPPPTFTPENTIASATKEKRCYRRGTRIQFNPQTPPGLIVVRSEVFVNGKAIEDNVGDAAVAPILLTMTKKTMRVRIKLTAYDGRVVEINRRFKACPKPKKRRPRR